MSVHIQVYIHIYIYIYTCILYLQVFAYVQATHTFSMQTFCKKFSSRHARSMDGSGKAWPWIIAWSNAFFACACGKPVGNRGVFDNTESCKPQVSYRQYQKFVMPSSGWTWGWFCVEALLLPPHYKPHLVHVKDMWTEAHQGAMVLMSFRWPSP